MELASISTGQCVPHHTSSQCHVSTSFPLLRVPAWGAKCFQPCASELAQWLSADEISAGGGGRGNFFTLHLKPPPAFRAGACVPNMEEP